MKKGFFPPLAVLAAVLAFCMWNSAAMASCSLRWQDQLRQAGGLAESGDWLAAAGVLQESYQDWSAKQTYLHIVTGHGAVDESEAMYRRCAAIAAAREDSEFQAELAGLQEQLRLLAEMERFSVRNVL